MKIKTAVISITVSAALVAGCGYGAYYAMQGKQTAVEVVPVANVNAGNWGMDSASVYGSVTSQVAQTVNLNEEYQIDQIYVKAGDTVKEGTPLFSYDMTLPELQLEMNQLDLQTKELTKVKLEKDLQKLQGTTATASLEQNDTIRTAAAEDGADAEILIEPSGDVQNDAGEVQSETASSEAESEAQKSNSGDAQPNADGLEVEKIEAVSGTTGDAGAEEQQAALLGAVSSYEQLVAAIDVLVRSYGDTLSAEDLSVAIPDAVAYYRKHLANQQILPQTNADGTAVEKISYVIKDTVKEALGEEGTAELEKYNTILEQYQVSYVNLLIKELTYRDSLDAEQIAKVRAEYEALTTAQKEQILTITPLEMAEEQGSAQMPQETMETDAGESGDAQTESGEAATEQAETSTETSTEAVESETGLAEEITDILDAEAQQSLDAAGETETNAQNEHTVTVTGGYIESAGLTGTFATGDTVSILADDVEDMAVFAGWTITAATEGVQVDLADPLSTSTSFIMPDSDVTVEAKFTPDPAKIQEKIDIFTAKAETAMGTEGAEKADCDTVELSDAILYFQNELAQYRAEIAAEIVDGEALKMNAYELRQLVKDYLLAQDGDGHLATNLETTYEKLCKTYVKTLILHLDPHALTLELLTNARNAYEGLGTDWKTQLDQSVKPEDTGTVPADGTTSNNGQTNDISQETQAQTGLSSESETETESETTASETVVLTYGELLSAYEMIFQIQQLQEQEKTAASGDAEFLAALAVARDTYYMLSAGQQSVVWNRDVLLGLLNKYGLAETESDTSLPSGGFGDFGGFDDGSGEGYTAEELKEMISEKERDIKDNALDIREAELAVQQQQRIVDGKVVKSTMDGTVISIGSTDGNADTDYFVKVANESGLYAKGVMNELSLEQIKVGDVISGMMTDSGLSFTAVIKEISQYPDPNGASNSYMGFGTENTNAAYYPFYALIDDTEGLEEGEAELQFSDTMSNASDSIYLEKYFVRTESDGKSYVYKEGSNGLLEKQYVTVRQASYSIEVTSGLSADDRIAFPYGTNVKEGAPTKEVDMLSDAYS